MRILIPLERKVFVKKQDILLMTVIARVKGLMQILRGKSLSK
jgi:hypothetical protein